MLEIMETAALFNQKSSRELKATSYIPAFRHSFLTPIYDFMMKWAARESAFKPQLVKHAGIGPGHRVLDVGCGTATLTILIKKTQPKAQVIGLDADARILEIARSKIAQTDLEIILDNGSASELPYPDNYFDRLFSSMVFHHLTRENKIRALKEAFRVLKPGGTLHVADLGKPQNPIMRIASLIIGRLEETSDNVKGLLPEMFSVAGFDQVEETSKYMTIFGTIALYKAQKPENPLRAGTNRSRHFKRTNEEAKYYSWLEKTASILAPFYDTVTIFISGVRDKVVDFADARNGARILDVGTGTGKQAFAFAKKGYNVVGIDLSENMLKVANKKNKYNNAKFEVADATNLPFDDNSFDVSCASFALHDMILSIREKTIKEMSRVTKPQGTVVIIDYALPENKIGRFLIYHLVKLYEKYYPEFIKSDLKALLKKSGIETVEELPVLFGAGRIVKGIKISDS